MQPKTSPWFGFLASATLSRSAGEGNHRKWQETPWPGLTSTSLGVSTLQRASA